MNLRPSARIHAAHYAAQCKRPTAKVATMFDPTIFEDHDRDTSIRRIPMFNPILLEEDHDRDYQMPDWFASALIGLSYLLVLVGGFFLGWVGMDLI